MADTLATTHPGLYERLLLFNISKCNILRFSYKPITHVKQKSYECGLVALAMCSPNPSTNFVKEIFEIAKKNNYTINGEIFSARDMLKLAKEILPNKTKITLYSGSLETNHIKETILNGDILLVPYDNSSDNGPSLGNGQWSHWAVILGGVETTSDFYVFARHGHGKVIRIWKLTDLALSNAQLNEFVPNESLSNRTFKLPKDGIAGPLGLKLQSIILSDL